MISIELKGITGNGYLVIDASGRTQTFDISFIDIVKPGCIFLNQLIAQGEPGGLFQYYYYDELGRLARTKSERGGETVDESAFTYPNDS